MKNARAFTFLAMLCGLAPLNAEVQEEITPQLIATWDIAKVGDVPFNVAGTISSGTNVSIEALKGKVVLVYFFHAKTGAGIQEFKLINKYIWTPLHPKGLEIIAVARDSKTSELTDVLKQVPTTIPVIADTDESIFHHFATRGHPRTYLIGRDGRIKFKNFGFDDDEVEAVRQASIRELSGTR